MKYLRITLSIFVITMMLAITSVKAGYLVFNDITIPTLKGIYTSNQVKKTSNSNQTILKRKCTDDVSGDNRIVIARTRNMYGGNNYSSWIEIPYSAATWGRENRDISDYKIQIQSNKSLMTTASFYGNWVLDNI